MYIIYLLFLKFSFLLAFSNSYKSKNVQRLGRPYNLRPLPLSSSSTSDHDRANSFGIEHSLASLGQFDDIFPDHSKLHLVQLTQPTGLFIAYLPSILTPSVIEASSKEYDLEQYKNDYICVLHHNSVGVSPLHNKVSEIPNILSKIQCREIIQKAESYATKNGGWTRERHTGYPTTDLPIECVFDSFDAIPALIKGEVLPRMAALFNLDPNFLKVDEMFIAKYEYGPGKQSSLGAHQDGTPFSFVLTLNEPDADFLGGGTRFVEEDEGKGVVYRPLQVGSAIAFCGKKLHEGVPVTNGVRYILTGFCEYNNEDTTHASYLDNYDARWDGNAAENGIQTGDILKGIFTYNDKGYEILTPTKDLPLESLYAAVIRSSLTKGTDIRVVVERNNRLQTNNNCNNKSTDTYEDASSGGEEEGESALGGHLLSGYIKANARRLFSSGHCWGFDDLLRQNNKTQAPT